MYLTDGSFLPADVSDWWQFLSADVSDWIHWNLFITHYSCRLLCRLLVIIKVIFANNVDPDQTAPLEQSDWVRTVCLYAKIGLKSLHENFSRQQKQTTFSDAGFLGVLRVNRWLVVYWIFQKMPSVIKMDQYFLWKKQGHHVLLSQNHTQIQHFFFLNHFNFYPPRLFSIWFWLASETVTKYSCWNLQSGFVFFITEVESSQFFGQVFRKSLF